MPVSWYQPNYDGGDDGDGDGGDDGDDGDDGGSINHGDDLSQSIATTTTIIIIFIEIITIIIIISITREVPQVQSRESSYASKPDWGFLEPWYWL